MFIGGALLGEDFVHYSKNLRRYKTARVVLPCGACPKGGWPICIVLHPFYASRSTWINKLIEYNEKIPKKIALVFPESGRRWFINDDQGNLYERYIVEDLLSEVSLKYPQLSNNKRILGGFSMGGAAALFVAMRSLGLFSYVFSISGAFHAAMRKGDPYECYRKSNILMPTELEHLRVWGEMGSLTRSTYSLIAILRYLKVEEVRSVMPEIWMEVGIHDFKRMLNMNRSAHTELNAKNIGHFYSEHPGGHDWKYATSAFTRILTEIELRIKDEKKHPNN